MSGLRPASTYWISSGGTRIGVADGDEAEAWILVSDAWRWALDSISCAPCCVEGGCWVKGAGDEHSILKHVLGADSLPYISI